MFLSLCYALITKALVLNKTPIINKRDPIYYQQAYSFHYFKLNIYENPMATKMSTTKAHKAFTNIWPKR